MNSGQIANKNGKILEEILEPAFKKYGYKIVKRSEFKKQEEFDAFVNEQEKLVIKNAPYKTIYGHKGKTEFLLKNKLLNKEIRIECKWQQVAGSVDEKIPYLYLNSVLAFEEQEIIIIIDGKGYKEGAINWLKTQVQNNWLNEKNKMIYVFEIQEFLKWFNDLHKDFCSIKENI